MASYADVASHGTQQSAEEARAPAPVELERHEPSDTHTLLDVDTPSVPTVSPDYQSQEVQTDTQADRHAREEARDAKKAAEDAAASAKPKAQGLLARLQRNADNPVFIGNAVVGAAVAAVLGVGAYRQWNSPRGFGGPWGVAMTAGAVGLVGAVDWVVSRWALENKYPARK